MSQNSDLTSKKGMLTMFVLYRCTCTFGFKGKTCEDREYCAVYQCPAGSECLNLDDGYECVANLTLNGINSSITYSPSFTNIQKPLNDITITYRSQVRFTQIFAENGFLFV